MNGSEVVVITGASAGVGRASAREFAKRRARIALIARNRTALQRARMEIEEAGGRALVFPIDIADAEAVEAAAAEIEQQFGAIDIWINNAMVSVFSPVKAMSAAEFKRVTDVTFLGTVYGTLAALKRMVERDRGVILQVGSALAYRSIPLQSAYCAAKHAVRGFNQSLRCELLHDKSNVKLIMVQLPALNTPQFSWVKTRLPREPQPVPPIFQPEVAARAIYWAAHHDRPEVYVGWPTVKAIVGNKIAPRYADRYLARHGYAAQQTEALVKPGRRDNLWQTVPGDHGAHGSFDDRASAFSAQFWLTKNRHWLALAGLWLAGAVVVARRSARGRSLETRFLESNPLQQPTGQSPCHGIEG